MISSHPTSLFRCSLESLGEGEECRAFTCSGVARVFFEDVSVKGAFCSEVSPTHLHCSRALGSACSPGYWQHWKRAHIVCIGSYAEDNDSTKEVSKQHLQDQWGLIDPETFKKKASKRDIDVTSRKDKPQQLEKLSHLPNILRELHNVSGVGDKVPHTICASGHSYLRDVCGAVNIIALRLMCCC